MSGRSNGQDAGDCSLAPDVSVIVLERCCNVISARNGLRAGDSARKCANLIDPDVVWVLRQCSNIARDDAASCAGQIDPSEFVGHESTEAVIEGIDVVDPVLCLRRSTS